MLQTHKGLACTPGHALLKAARRTRVPPGCNRTGLVATQVPPGCPWWVPDGPASSPDATGNWRGRPRRQCARAAQQVASGWRPGAAGCLECGQVRRHWGHAPLSPQPSSLIGCGEVEDGGPWVDGGPPRWEIARCSHNPMHGVAHAKAVRACPVSTSSTRAMLQLLLLCYPTQIGVLPAVTAAVTQVTQGNKAAGW